MQGRPRHGLWACLALFLLLAHPAWAQEEAGEVRIRVVNLYPYDLVFLPEPSLACPEEGGQFLVEPETVPFFGTGFLAFKEGCPARVVYSLRYFTGVFLNLYYDPVKDRLWALSSSVVLDTRVASGRGEEGDRLFTVWVFNGESRFDEP